MLAFAAPCRAEWNIISYTYKGTTLEEVNAPPPKSGTTKITISAPKLESQSTVVSTAQCFTRGEATGVMSADMEYTVPPGETFTVTPTGTATVKTKSTTTINITPPSGQNSAKAQTQDQIAQIPGQSLVPSSTVTASKPYGGDAEKVIHVSIGVSVITSASTVGGAAGSAVAKSEVTFTK